MPVTETGQAAGPFFLELSPCQAVEKEAGLHFCFIEIT